MEEFIPSKQFVKAADCSHDGFRLPRMQKNISKAQKSTKA